MAYLKVMVHGDPPDQVLAISRVYNLRGIHHTEWEDCALKVGKNKR